MAQNGNVWEWEETAWDLVNNTTGEGRGLRGGSWINKEEDLHLEFRGYDFITPELQFSDSGFRVAGVSVVPEPLRTLLGVVGLCSILMRRRR